MKAIVCNAFGSIEEIEYSEVPDPQAGPGQVVLATKAIGVNFPDGLLVQGLYQYKPELPFVPGIEVAGVVEAVGPDVSNLKLGDRILASTMTGGYAEKLCLDTAAAIAIPDAMSDTHAAVLPCAYGTAHHALKQRGKLQPGETLAVLGAAGGTGLAAVQIGKAMGARVIAVCSDEEKLSLAADSGADELINYRNADLRKSLMSITKNRGVDVVFDPVGGEAFNRCARAMAWNGRLLVIGFASGDIPQFPVNLALVKGYSVIGVFWGSFTRYQPKDYANNMAELFRWYEQGKVRPLIDKTFPLSSAAEALHLVAQRKVKGKLVLVP
ncbi:NADPH:quinone oxidoreductase [Geothermobacter hydrogeniphilus]|uniref:NADPH:quinone oxidoreductase n=1 Tax=Geothermobacter hydrogeniphilus TaxID=1969733 RepID=A0A2K2H5N9_9BACT|nr:NADPH:quinone oxidoreductase family protein [Geothermobacter hydrogeniphilus]PNU18632.1 NADPH:quinone oxidoreductase [Geothermobacter hydrogeniphilus]